MKGFMWKFWHHTVPKHCCLVTNTEFSTCLFMYFWEDNFRVWSPTCLIIMNTLSYFESILESKRNSFIDVIMNKKEVLEFNMIREFKNSRFLVQKNLLRCRKSIFSSLENKKEWNIFCPLGSNMRQHHVPTTTFCYVEKFVYSEYGKPSYFE